jgi:hypothetical protein
LFNVQFSYGIDGGASRNVLLKMLREGASENDKRQLNIEQ